MKSLRLHATEPASRANGPGLRAVVWFQGCTLGCPGCFNSHTHPPDAGMTTDTASLAATILTSPEGITGVSISGGEPYQQPEALLDLLIRLHGSGLSRLVFSGYTIKEIEAQPLGPAILTHLDVLIAGRYVQTRNHGRDLLGSSNQRIHLLTGRHAMKEFEGIPTTEIILRPDGSITLTGVAPARFPDA